MQLLKSLRSQLSGQSQEQFGLGEKHPLSKSMKTVVKAHIMGLRGSDLAGYMFERRHSDYAGAKSDLIIYDAEGKAVLKGREASDGRLSIWE